MSSFRGNNVPPPVVTGSQGSNSPAIYSSPLGPTAHTGHTLTHPQHSPAVQNDTLVS